MKVQYVNYDKISGGEEATEKKIVSDCISGRIVNIDTLELIGNENFFRDGNILQEKIKRFFSNDLIGIITYEILD